MYSPKALGHVKFNVPDLLTCANTCSILSLRQTNTLQKGFGDKLLVFTHAFSPPGSTDNTENEVLRH